MNINFYYKGQIVPTKSDLKFDLKRVFECSLSKFEPHFYKELALFSSNLRLRCKRTNSLLNFSDIIGRKLQDNDTIIIEPKENLTSGSPNIHAPKRYDISNIDNNYSPMVIKPSEYSMMKNNITPKPKTSTKYPFPMNNRNADNGYLYQKSEQTRSPSKVSHKLRNSFERNNLRRSLGANIAPQYDIQAYNTNRVDNGDSDSSISDFTNLANQRHAQFDQTQSNATGHEKRMSVSKSAPASPTKSTRRQQSASAQTPMLNAYNVRTIGNKINISIVKKPVTGFGFTIVTRDNQVIYGSSTDIANSVVILVNKILSNGGAALDNRLKPGDRLLEINGFPFTSHSDAMEKLRAIPENESVNLLISRVEQCEMQSKEELLPNNSQLQLSKKEITFDIPLNQNQKQRQQLGLNIQCLSDTDDPNMGPGIYIHSIVANSLASQQGGLSPGDKIIGINDRNLDYASADETIYQLKKVMQTDPVLSITVYRTVNIVSPHANDRELQKKEQNYKLLPNRISLEKKTAHCSEHLNSLSMSHYSSSDSLSFHTTGVCHPEPCSAFARDSKGRRSMSDKRKAHEDASKYTFYQQSQVGDGSVSDDRLYSTLPTASRLKKMSNNDTPCLPNKIQVPVKPSQIKQLNAPKIQQDRIVKAPKVPSRSISLRTSPTRLNQRVLEPSQSPKLVSQTPTHDLQLPFNRAMNNSFKRAVQKSLLDNEQYPLNINSPEQSFSVQNELANIQHQSPTEYPYTVYCGYQNNERIPRSNSVKSPEERSQNFNLKTFLTFTPNLSRPKNSLTKEKSNTLPLNEPPQYYSQSVNSNVKHSGYSPVQLPQEIQPYDDPMIIDSTKRVIEWQMKNDDVISKENMRKEHRIYHSNGPYGTANYKNKADVNLSNRTPFPNKIIVHGNSNSDHDTDPYDSIDGVRATPTALSKPKLSHPKSARSKSQLSITPMSPTNGISSHNTRITYQIQSPPNDMYATVNKGAKKEIGTQKEPFGASQSHINKYRF